MHRAGTAAARAPSKHPERSDRPKDTRHQPQSREHERQLGSSHGSESRTRNITRSSSERRDRVHSDRASVDHHEDHSIRKRTRDSSPKYGDRQRDRRSSHGSRSMMTPEEDASDDERNFKRRWGRRSSGGVDTRH